MSLLGTQVFANPATPCWLSTAGGAVDGPLTVKDSLAVIPSTLSGSASLILGPEPTGDAPYTSLIVSTPVDIDTSLGSELLFYTRRNTPALPPSLAMSIDSVQDITMEQNLNVVGTITATTLNATTVNATTVNATSFSPIRGDITYAGIGAGNQAMTFVGGLAGNIIQENALYLMSFDVLIQSSGVAVPAGLHSVLVQTSTGTSAVGWASTITIPAGPEYRLFSVTGLLQGFGAAPQPLVGTLFLPNALPAGSFIQTNNAILLRIA